MKLEFSRKKLKYQVSSKSIHWEPSCLFHADRGADMKLIVAFRNLANAPKHDKVVVSIYSKSARRMNILLTFSLKVTRWRAHAETRSFFYFFFFLRYDNESITSKRSCRMDYYTDLLLNIPYHNRIYSIESYFQLHFKTLHST